MNTKKYGLYLLIFTFPLMGFISYSKAQLRTQKPLALIYFGEGSCAQWNYVSGCSEAARDIAISAGFDVEYVNPTDPVPEDSFNRASLWIQPGGRARLQEKAMSDALKKRIIEFVKSGGGYVGFCAGGFLATEKFGWMTEDEKGNEIPFEANGLGFLPGKSWYYNDYDEELSQDLMAKIIPTTWDGKTRQVYWELGPYFLPETYKGSQVLAYYQKLDGTEDLDKAMTIYSQFGLGKVAITAVHPEAPTSWRTYYKIFDTDGNDFALAQAMMNWARAQK